MPTSSLPLCRCMGARLAPSSHFRRFCVPLFSAGHEERLVFRFDYRPTWSRIGHCRRHCWASTLCEVLRCHSYATSSFACDRSLSLFLLLSPKQHGMGALSRPIRRTLESPGHARISRQLAPLDCGFPSAESCADPRGSPFTRYCLLKPP